MLITQSDEDDVSKNNEGIELSNYDPFGSPAFNMGPETHVEVFRSSDKACAEFHGGKNQRDMGGPSFSIGLTQDRYLQRKKTWKEVGQERLTNMK